MAWRSLEVHGKGSSDLAVIEEIMRVADQRTWEFAGIPMPATFINGSVRRTSTGEEKAGRTCHINELYSAILS